MLKKKKITRKKAMITAWKTIMPTKKAYVSWLISCIIGIILAIILGISSITVTAFSSSVEVLNGIILALVAMVMGAYALFQALLSDEMIVLLSENTECKDEDTLNVLNDSFLGTVILYWFLIIANSILIIILKVVPEDFLISKNLCVSNSLAIFLMLIYYTVVFRSIIEFRNFTVNIYNVFRTYNLKVLLNKKKEQNQKK